MTRYQYDTKLEAVQARNEGIKPSGWLRIERANTAEVEDIVSALKLDSEIVEDALDPHEIPRAEVENGSFYFITRLPDTDDEFNDFTTPIMFVLHPDMIISISRDSLERLWQPFIDRNKGVERNQIHTFVAMIEALIGEYQKKVSAINRQMRAVSADVARLRSKNIAIFVEHERKLNDYLDALIATDGAMEKLAGSKLIKLTADERDILQDLILDYRQIIARCKSLLRTITNVRDSFRAIMDTRLNETISLLTVITLALTIPTMIAALYGMNVELPGQENSPLTFWIIAFLSFATSGVLAFYFLFRRR